MHVGLKLVVDLTLFVGYCNIYIYIHTKLYITIYNALFYIIYYSYMCIYNFVMHNFRQISAFILPSVVLHSYLKCMCVYIL